MSKEIDDEVSALKRECEWVLREEVISSLQELKSVLTEACNSFPTQILTGAEHGGVGKPEKFILSNANGPQQVKCVMTLMGEQICDAELSVKLARNPTASLTRIYPDAPWRLQQVQDASNYLWRALSLLDSIDQSSDINSAQKTLRLLSDVTRYMNKGRACLAMPKRKTLNELINNPSMTCLKPPLSKDLAVSFYVQAQKVVLCVYSITSAPVNRYDISSRVQAECTVPWLNDILVLFTLALQLCQQLIDKISLFVQYEAELQTPILESGNKAVSPMLDLSDTSHTQHSQTKASAHGQSAQSSNQKPAGLGTSKTGISGETSPLAQNIRGHNTMMQATRDMNQTRQGTSNIQQSKSDISSLSQTKDNEQTNIALSGNVQKSSSRSKENSALVDKQNAGNLLNMGASKDETPVLMATRL